MEFSRSISPPFTARSPAKINLHLRIAPPRADGFHPLLSWMATIGLFDNLHFRQAAATQLTCNDPSIPTDGSNLILKAIAALNAITPVPSVAIHLEKRIPAGGGLGGGSSNAATTLQAINQFIPTPLSAQRLHDVAAQLGSDVPFFLHGPSSICTGRGEVVRPIPIPAIARWVTLILPQITMPTAAVYRRFDELNLGQMDDRMTKPDWQSWITLPAAELLRLLVNDLEPPAFAINPALGQLRADIEQLLGRITRMSGSGSSLFTLFDSQFQADQAATQTIQTLNVRALAIQLCPPI